MTAARISAIPVIAPLPLWYISRWPWYEAERQQPVHILPIEVAMDCYYQQQMHCLEEQQNRQQVQADNATCSPA